MVAHPQSAMVVSALSSNFSFIGFTVLHIVFGDTAIFIFWHSGWYFPQKMTSTIVVTPKRHFLARKHVVWAIKYENRSNGSTWARVRKRKGQDSQRSQARYISPIWGGAPTGPIFTEMYTVIAVHDVITCANIWTEISRVTILQGVEFPIFLLILAWALQQCSANAPPVIERSKILSRTKKTQCGIDGALGLRRPR